jgi:hypothetical protein
MEDAAKPVTIDFSSLPVGAHGDLTIVVECSGTKVVEDTWTGTLDRDDQAEIVENAFTREGGKVKLIGNGKTITELCVYGWTVDGKYRPVTDIKVSSKSLKKDQLPKVKNRQKKV